ncbi:MAG: phage Gp37/Gp68 family protein [Oscillospiraceae bacterium]|nr:phage Gp37/Gp68 family protein [Oscillospiraceae bacterium]
MHDIWNPWHGCIKISEGCDNCYMYFLDRIRNKNGMEIYSTQNFDYQLKKYRKGN